MCPACLIAWPTSNGNPYDEVEPQFTNEDAETCGHKAPRTGRGLVPGGRKYKITYFDCWLPVGHTSKHDHNEEYVFEPKGNQ